MGWFNLIKASSDIEVGVIILVSCLVAKKLVRVDNEYGYKK